MLAVAVVLGVVLVGERRRKGFVRGERERERERERVVFVEGVVAVAYPHRRIEMLLPESPHRASDRDQTT